MFSPRIRLAMLVMPLMSLLTLPAAAAAQEKTEYETLIDQTAEALITVKCVLKMQGSMGNRETEQEFTALMIDGKGLVLCSATDLGTSRLFRQFGTVTPTDVKVLIGDDTEGVDAELIATDSELNLSWIQIKEPAEKPYVFVDLSRSTQARPGDRLLSVSRMEKYFDRSPIVLEGKLAGSTTKPRDLLIPSEDLNASPGLPVFSSKGVSIGVMVLQTPDPEDMAAARRSLSSARAILPSEAVVKATARARAMAESEEDEEDDPAPAAETESAESPESGSGSEDRSDSDGDE